MKLFKYMVLAVGLLVTVDVSAENVWDRQTQTFEKPIDIVVYRSPTCGCCGKWLKHLEKHQFEVRDVITEDMDSIKQKYGIPRQLASCHTAVVDGYVIEGHVPAADIKTLLKDKPDIIGITVPGMPSGTPGMEMGDRKDAFNVISFDKDGHIKVFHSYEDY